MPKITFTEHLHGQWLRVGVIVMPTGDLVCGTHTWPVATPDALPQPLPGVALGTCPAVLDGG